MPFKANADRRHHIPAQQHRVRNWAEYDAGLRARGSLTVWFTAEAIEAWCAAPRTTRGGQPCYSDLAITTALTLRAVFRLPLRQTEGLIGSILQLLGLDLPVPDHSTLMWTTGFQQPPFAVLHCPFATDHGRRLLPRPHLEKIGAACASSASSASSTRSDVGSLCCAWW